MNILVVDDSMAMRLIVIKTLRASGYDGHEIEQAADGVEALEMIKAAKPDMVLCDWNMPNKTGPELLQELNNQGITPLFGFVTTESTPEMKSKANELGARFMISKPFTPETFKKTLEPFFK